jgi:glycosyltransferase involved in cell wall biosynthesis
MARITIEYTGAAQGGGVGRSVRDLTAALLRQASQHNFTLWYAGQKRDLALTPAHITHTFMDPIWLTRLWHRAHIPFPVEWLSGACDVFFATDFALPPTRTDKTVLLIHDLSYIRVPDAAFPALKAYLDNVVPRSVKRATHIVVNSQATKNDVVELYGVEPSKITPLTFGVSPIFRRITQPRSAVTAIFPVLERPYILAVGTVQPRKNYIHLIEALKILQRTGHDVDLVIVGGKGWLSDPIYEAANAPDIRQHVHMLGHVEDTQLPLLYSHAACFAMPSLYEGFGLPVLEAMACGTPVVTSNSSSLPEAAGDAGILCDPYHVESIADALTRVLSDSNLREKCIRRGYSHVAGHTWDAGAQDLLGVFDGLLS